jgi:hypothetical protein
MGSSFMLLKNIFKNELNYSWIASKTKVEIFFWTVLYILNTKYPENIPNKTR